ncbi:collagen, type I, alpha 1b [Equus caballus]|uniref:collagen, type I, alpha 1b n=1 Tax=Equus caballus TaxID=9796 RepID=UPI0038B33FEB
MPKRRILGWPISGPYSTPGLTEPARRASSQGDPRRHRPCPGKSSLGAIQRPLISRAGERVGELGPREADAWSADGRAQVGPTVPQGTQGGDGAAALPHPISRPTRSGSPRGPLPTRRGHSGPRPPSPHPVRDCGARGVARAQRPLGGLRPAGSSSRQNAKEGQGRRRYVNTNGLQPGPPDGTRRAERTPRSTPHGPVSADAARTTRAGEHRTATRHPQLRDGPDAPPACGLETPDATCPPGARGLLGFSGETPDPRVPESPLHSGSSCGPAPMAAARPSPPSPLIRSASAPSVPPLSTWPLRPPLRPSALSLIPRPSPPNSGSFRGSSTLSSTLGPFRRHLALPSPPGSVEALLLRHSRPFLSPLGSFLQDSVTRTSSALSASWRLFPSPPGLCDSHNLGALGQPSVLSVAPPAPGPDVLVSLQAQPAGRARVRWAVAVSVLKLQLAENCAPGI